MTASVTHIRRTGNVARYKGNDMNNVLLMDTKGLAGVYVVTDGLNSKIVVASSENPEDAYKLAVESGVADPVLVYVPTESEKTSVLWQS